MQDQSSLSTPVATTGPWRRRMSQPNPSLQHHTFSPPATAVPLPLGFPTVSASGLRTALLGYLGEAENAIRERLGMDPVADDELYDVEPEHDAHRRLSVTSSPSPSSEDETDIDGSYYRSSTTSALAAPGESQLRRRTHGPRTGIPRPPRNPHSPPPTLEEHAILDSLRKLREDILAYVPAVPAGLSGFTPNREWLQSLPNRLQDLDLGLSQALSDQAWPDPVSASHRAMNGARQRVIDIVHSALPPDDWAGWETLGWGNQDKDRRRTRGHHAKSCSLDEKWARLDDEEELLDEPEYLFPNRTPGPAGDIARRRLKRSKSLGDSDFAFHAPSFLDQWIRPVVEAAAIVDDEGEADLAEIDAQAIEDDLAAAEEDLHAHEVAVPCEKHGAHQVLDASYVPTVAEAVERSLNGKKLITFHDLPVWWRNNQYILTSYRFIPLDRKEGPIPLIKSAFKVHNETVNIHSHFIPTLFIMCFIPFIVWRTPLPDAHWIDTAMLISYLLAASSCMSSSAGWHVLAGCANRRWFEWGACVDYIGISWLIALSFNTVVYNAYYCRPKTVVTFTSINVAFGALGSYLPFQKWFNQRKNKHWRILFFLTLNAAMFAPLVNLFFEHGVAKGREFVKPFINSVLMYVFGLVFYAFHFPECMFPGKFDLCGASHNMWHIGIVFAIILHYNGIFHAFDKRWDYSCAAPDAGTPFPIAVQTFLLG